jgi:hypothetical protein
MTLGVATTTQRDKILVGFLVEVPVLRVVNVDPIG